MSEDSPRQLGTLEKALEINLDGERYGTFAEIGAGQEVVRWFFQAGGAAGTISKSISAYDMQVSDVIYGESDRYVSRQRLEAMLDCEQALNRERLGALRGKETSFFTFADTVSARNYHGTNECHAWMGIRFQARPGSSDSVIVLHARMLDDNNAAQQEALGILGVNLIHAAYSHAASPEQIIASLLENLSIERIEVDLIDFSGELFADIDNRVLTLRLVELGLTGAAMFSADGDVLQPCEALRKRPLLLQRGRFRPLTHVNIDLLQSALRQFVECSAAEEQSVLPIMEISMHDLMEDGQVCLEDFVSRADVISTTGCVVMISDFREYHRLATYLSRSTNQPIGFAMGLAALRRLFEERYYEDLEGGILESFGRLCKNQLKLFIYPIKNNENGIVETLADVELTPPLQHLFNYLRSRNVIVGIDNASHEFLDIHSPDVLEQISNNSGNWAQLVPDSVADIIKERKLFGYTG